MFEMEIQGPNGMREMWSNTKIMTLYHFQIIQLFHN